MAQWVSSSSTTTTFAPRGTRKPSSTLSWNPRTTLAPSWPAGTPRCSVPANPRKRVDHDRCRVSEAVCEHACQKRKATSRCAVDALYSREVDPEVDLGSSPVAAPTNCFVMLFYRERLASGSGGFPKSAAYGSDFPGHANQHRLCYRKDQRYHRLTGIGEFSLSPLPTVSRL